MEKWELKDCRKRGRIERVDYQAECKDGTMVDKYANVYVPYGYDASKKYNILYVMHGGGGSPDAWLDQGPVKNILDHMINNGELEPLLVAFVTYYMGEDDTFSPGEERNRIYYFQKELPETLVPAVESRYSTYAETLDEAGRKASRKHRAFCGFSMGGATTWCVIEKNYDTFAWFAPISGDSWIIEQMGGRICPDQTAQALHDIYAASGYGKGDYLIYTITGTEDGAYQQLKPQSEAMVKFPDTFGPENFKYHFEEGYVHAYDNVANYIRIFLPEFFK